MWIWGLSGLPDRGPWPKPWLWLWLWPWSLSSCPSFFITLLFSLRQFPSFPYFVHFHTWFCILDDLWDEMISCKQCLEWILEHSKYSLSQCWPLFPFKSVGKKKNIKESALFWVWDYRLAAIEAAVDWQVYTLLNLFSNAFAGDQHGAQPIFHISPLSEASYASHM